MSSSSSLCSWLCNYSLSKNSSIRNWTLHMKPCRRKTLDANTDKITPPFYPMHRWKIDSMTFWVLKTTVNESVVTVTVQQRKTTSWIIERRKRKWMIIKGRKSWLFPFSVPRSSCRREMKMFWYSFLSTICMMGTIGTVPVSEFFPFGSAANDQVLPPNDDGSTNALPLPRLFPYFNNNHQQIYLANNGLFSFLGPISTYVPIAFPLSNGQRLVAGFWSDIDTRGNIPLGNAVYYHIYDNQNSTMVFEKAASYVQQYFPAERAFTPRMVITGTWYRVGAFSYQTTRTNTFQIVLATDEIRSFAFILYHELQWASPASGSGANVSNELGGQAGFNAGDGVVFEMLPYSRSSNVRLLANVSNVNVPGLFVFRVDTDTIAVGGCGNTSSLLFRPRRGSQLGSTAITVQGPCFNNMSAGDVKCRFGDSLIVDAVIVNDIQVICLVPPMALPAIVQFYLSTDGGNTFRLFPNTFAYTPAEYGLSSSDNAQITVLNRTSIIVSTGVSLTLGWYLSDTSMDIWPNNTVRLEVQMWTVSLNDSNGGIIENGNTVLQTNIVPVIGYQWATVTIPSRSNSDVAIIFFRIVARDTLINTIYGGLNSALFVLNGSGSTTPNHCHAWASAQPPASTWNENLLPCPLTLTQARVARCCYEPDPLCRENAYESPINCAARQGRLSENEESAVACYLSRRTNEWNAGTECCYAASGQLITRGTGGGTDDRYLPASFPVLHFFSDTLPFLSCCLLTSDEETCARYFTLRPHRRGSNSPNAWSGTWGDPHFTTLDGSAYTFNGYGEYTYLAIANSSVAVNTPFNPATQELIFEAQVRTAPLVTVSGAQANSATVIRGVAARSNDPLAQKMSITVSRREQLIVRRGNETLDLDANSDDTIGTNNSLVLFFPELTLELNRTSGVLTLSWYIGVSIQLTPVSVSTSVPTALVLNMGVSVAASFRSRTFGLLGLFDNNPSNDLRAQNGTIVGQPSGLTLEQIHWQFGQTWLINPVRSLFYYEPGDSAAFYATQTLFYVPSFLPPSPPAAQVNVTLSVCNIDPSSTNRSAWTVAQATCYYDIAVTSDLSLGAVSRTAADTIVQIANDQRSPPQFNANLPLVLTVSRASSVTIDFTAVSPYSPNIAYTLEQGPSTASFDNQTALFQWQTTAATHDVTVVRVTARDAQYGLLSRHELVVRIVDIANTTTVTPTTTSAAIATSSGQSLISQTSITAVVSMLSLISVFGKFIFS